MKTSDFLYKTARLVFFVMAFVVIWHLFAPQDWHALTEIGRKIWAMAGLGLYVVIMIERHRRWRDRDDISD